MPETHNHTNDTPGLLMVVSGPSGVGKTTITRALVERFNAVFSVSATTRPQTTADKPGDDYVFMTTEEFKALAEAGQLLEYARVFGQFYGTPRQPINEALAKGRIVLLEIDVQGALQVRKAMPAALMLFILPPSEEELLVRLRGRRRESEEQIQRRFQEAQTEIGLAKDSEAYDHFVINDDLDRAILEATELVNQRLQQGADGGDG